MSRKARSLALDEPRAVRLVLTTAALSFLAVFLVLPLVVVFSEALRPGLKAFNAAIREPYTRSAAALTLKAAAVAVPVNFVFGVASAWAVARFRFRGRSVLTTLIDLPFSVSPVVSGMLFMLLFGAQGFLGQFLTDRGFRIVFAYPGILLATIFVTSPLVARELIPVLEAQGSEEEEAALTLGAGGWRTFFLVSLPKMRWGIVYGVVLCNARAMGEFGAVSVVSGHIRGRTNTLPLHVEILYNEYRFGDAFSVASVLTLLALVTLVVKYAVERRTAGTEPG